MKKLVLIALIATGFAVSAKAQPTTANPPDPNAPSMTFVTDTIDFGTITQGDTVDRDFKFKNSGKSPLVITEAKAGCGCTTPTFSKEPIGPGKSSSIHVHFNSTGKMGMQYKPVTITTNGGTFVVVLKGNVVAPTQGPKPGGPDPARSGAPTNGGN